MIIYPYEFWVGERIISFSFTPPDRLLCVFTENDRVEKTEYVAEDETYTTYWYRSNTALVRDRLDLMGFTQERYRSQLRRFRTEIAESIKRELEFAPRSSIRLRRKLLVIEHSCDMRWLEAELSLVHRQWQHRYHFPFRVSVLEECLVGGDWTNPSVIDSPFEDERDFLRACIDLSDDTDLVAFDFTSALDEFDLSQETRFIEQAFDNLRVPARAIEQILVVAEGKSDSLLLKRGISRLYPHLEHIFSFLDHLAFRGPGGIGHLGLLIRSLAGLGFANRLIAVFDNDAAGTAEAGRLRKNQLPPNFRIVTLPSLEDGRNYPTVGPSGNNFEDINGKACSLEMYCGYRALRKPSGDLPQVRWTSYERSIEKYQGEVEDKVGVQERFIEQLDSSTDPNRDPEFDNMRLVLQAIIRAFR